jgi:predicted nucleic-acid-binding protein
MRAVDTNVLVRLITRDDPRRINSAEAFTESGAWVPLIVLAECVWVLSTVYDVSTSRQAGAIAMLLQHRKLVLQDREIVVAALELFRVHPSLGFSDCLVIASARSVSPQ